MTEKSCTPHELDFIIVDTDPEMAVVEDDIRVNLQKIGITVNTHKLDQETYIETERNGSYSMLFTRTWVRNVCPLYLTCFDLALNNCLSLFCCHHVSHREHHTILIAISLRGRSLPMLSTLPLEEWRNR